MMNSRLFCGTDQFTHQMNNANSLKSTQISLFRLFLSSLLPRMNITNDPMSFSDCPRDYSLANHRTEAIVLVGINILSCFLGTIGNLLVFMTVFNTPAMNQSSFHYFVSSLAMGDLINALVSQPLLVVLIAGRASSLCLSVIHRTFRWISNIGFGTSHLTPFLISLDRCLTVSGKFNYKKTMTVGKKATLVMIWLLAFAHAAIRITSNTENVTFFVYAIVGLSYAFYAFVLYKIYKHNNYLPKPQKKIRRNTGTAEVNQSYKVTQENHIAVTLATILFCLTVSWVPLFYHSITQPGKHYGLQYYTMVTCSFFVLAFNPFLYCFRNTKYRKTYNEIYTSVFGGVAGRKLAGKLKESTDMRISIEELKSAPAVDSVTFCTVLK
ncbi:adenosine receptor A1-like [Acropora millepora]|uniref:adenosine receptor A1-like n=1 Tax=Acropora millepora TaxID=45264 RepID=UPI001CF324BA|nr:adenosine receptor A1-like [Acropora millepora]